MIIHASIIIIICFKEIYSWNSILANNFLFTSFIPQSYYSNKEAKFLKKRSASKDNLSEISPTTVGEPTLFTNKSTRDDSLSENLNENFTINIPISAITSNPVSSPKFIDRTSATSQRSKANTGTVKILTTLSSTVEEPGDKNWTVMSTRKFSSPEIPVNFTSPTITMTENVTYQYIPTNSTDITYGEENGQLHSVHYILIALSVIVILCIIAYGVYHLYRKEQVRRLRLQLMPVYNFDPTESDDWENNLLEEEFSLRSKDKEKNTTTSTGATISVSEETAAVPIRQRSNVPVTHL